MEGGSQIVDRDSGNLYPIYIYKTNCGVSFWACWREISGYRVALFYIKLFYEEMPVRYEFINIWNNSLDLQVSITMLMALLL